MNSTATRLALVLWLAIPTFLFGPSPSAARAAGPSQVIVIEPDNYANGQILNTISPHVTLSTGAFSDFRPTFDVEAVNDPPGATTGTQVFAQGPGIPFWNSGRALRMDFHSLVSSIQLDYKPSGFFDNLYTCQLEAYSSSGVLLHRYVTSPLAAGHFETMTVTAPRIDYALAYPPEDPFGDLDNLRFSVVPEPNTLLLGACLLCASPLFRWKRPLGPRRFAC